MTKRIYPNGVPCHRCAAVLAVHAINLIDGYEYVCRACMTPAELVAFGLEPADG